MRSNFWSEPSSALCTMQAVKALARMRVCTGWSETVLIIYQKFHAGSFFLPHQAAAQTLCMLGIILHAFLLSTNFFQN